MGLSQWLWDSTFEAMLDDFYGGFKGDHVADAYVDGFGVWFCGNDFTDDLSFVNQQGFAIPFDWGRQQSVSPTLIQDGWQTRTCKDAPIPVHQPEKRQVEPSVF